MRAIKQPIPINLLIPKTLSLILQKRILIILNIELMTLPVIFFDYSFGQFLIGIRSLEKGILETTEFLREVAEDVGTGDLYQGFIPSLEENHVVFVDVREDGIAQDEVDTLPVLGNHALLIQVDEVAFYLGVFVVILITVVKAAILTIQSVAESLHFVHLVLD